MSRGMGEVELLEEVFPEWAVAVAGVLTQLGDGWFLVVLLGAVFLFVPDHRVDAVALFGAALGATGLYRGLKHLFALPRPGVSPLDSEGLHPVVEAVLELTATPVSYGFPSGHATGAAVVYFGLASVLTVGTLRRRLAAAATVVGVVAATRLVLAVHYLVDVLAGVALGAAFVGLVFALPRRLYPDHRVRIAYATALPTAGFYAVASGGTTESLLLVGVSAAVLGGWPLLAGSRWGRRLGVAG